MYKVKASPRSEALQAAKLAVRTYARNPSDEHQAAVEEAWQRVRQLNSVERWRERAPN